MIYAWYEFLATHNVFYQDLISGGVSKNFDMNNEVLCSNCSRIKVFNFMHCWRNSLLLNVDHVVNLRFSKPPLLLKLLNVKMKNKKVQIVKLSKAVICWIPMCRCLRVLTSLQIFHKNSRQILLQLQCVWLFSRDMIFRSWRVGWSSILFWTVVHQTFEVHINLDWFW